MRCLILILLISFISACSPKPAGYMVDSLYNYYINDDLKISVASPYLDQVIAVPQGRHFQKEFLKKQGMPYNKNLTLLFYSNYERYHLKNFLFLQSEKAPYSIPKDNVERYQYKTDEFYEDSVRLIQTGDVSSYSKAYYIDTINLVSYYPFSGADGTHFLLISKKEKDGTDSFDLAMLHGLTLSLLPRITTGNNYLKELSFSNPQTIAEDEFWYPSAGNYLGAITVVEKKVPEVQKTKIINDYREALLQYFALTDNTDSALHYYYKTREKIIKTLSESDKAILNKIKEDATPVILDSAKNYEIIAINENHSNPASRYYLASILSKLKEEGFTNIGMEALGTDNVDSLKKMSYYNGFYTRNPGFTCLINTALELNMNIFNYEDTTAGRKTFEQRDENQAINIINQLSKIGSGKTILFCGFAHLAKNGNLKTMVQFVQEKLHKKVLSIDMESLTTSFPDEFTTDTVPLVFNSTANGSGMLLNRHNADLRVFIPKSAIIPIKKSMGFQRTEIDLPDSLLKTPDRKAVYIYKYPYTDPAVNQPVFIDLSQLKKQTTAYLKKGEYIINVADDKKNVLYTNQFEVK